MKWPKNIAEARGIQELHRNRIRTVPLDKDPVYVAGVDAAFSEDLVFAAACLYRCPELTLVEQSSSMLKATFPYVPGYLLFREGPAIIAAINKLSRSPDVILVDGHGIAHPRGIGSASHLGILLDIPTIGCAKTKLVGTGETPEVHKGRWAPLQYKGNVVGAVLRTKRNVRPLFISPGHDINLGDAIRVTMACIGRYRIPEPLRCADMLSKRIKSCAIW